jgi:hypothetical protein
LREVPLVADPTYGTAISVTNGNDQVTTPVAWPRGFTGRRVGSEVEVLDPHGNVVATTGHNFTVSGGYASEGLMGVSFSYRARSAFLECDAGYADPQAWSKRRDAAEPVPSAEIGATT